MDSLKEKDKPAPKLSKRPRIEVDEEMMRRMIAGQAPMDSDVVRRIPEPEEENTDAPAGKHTEYCARSIGIDCRENRCHLRCESRERVFRIPAQKNLTARLRTDFLRIGGLP